jgi:hypothetical protein
MNSCSPLGYRCLALTGTFETNMAPPDCFGCVAGDFDGQGMSYSALQWNLGQGTLQALLADADRAHAAVIQKAFEADYPSLTAMLAMPRHQQLTWARSIQTPRHLLVDTWAGYFRALGRTPEFQAVATSHAEAFYAAALDLCRTYGLTSERAVALMFDIKVQNGGMSPAVQALIQSDFAALPAADADTTEVAKLRIIANRRADTAAPAWREDVRTRKLAIANGAGAVHGRSFDLAGQFGITLAAWR